MCEIGATRGISQRSLIDLNDTCWAHGWCRNCYAYIFEMFNFSSQSRSYYMYYYGDWMYA